MPRGRERLKEKLTISVPVFLVSISLLIVIIETEKSLDLQAKVVNFFPCRSPSLFHCLDFVHSQFFVVQSCLIRSFSLDRTLSEGYFVIRVGLSTTITFLSTSPAMY